MSTVREYVQDYPNDSQDVILIMRRGIIKPRGNGSLVEPNPKTHTSGGKKHLIDTYCAENYHGGPVYLQWHYCHDCKKVTAKMLWGLETDENKYQTMLERDLLAEMSANE